MLMTHLTKITLLGAVALLTAACAKEVGTDNPNFNAETNEVKTHFVFNVSTAQETKQSSAATQASASELFRGIENAALLTYAEPVGTKILAADKDANKYFDLAAVAAPSQLSATNSRRVLELSLPIQTNVLLFYGKAPYGEQDGTYKNKKDYYGYMDNYSIGKTAGSANFEAGKRLSDEEYVQFKTVENLFAGIMSMLLNTKLAENTVISKDAHPDGVTTTYKYDVTLTSDIAWENYNDDSGMSPYDPSNELYPLESKLTLLYSQLTTINTAGGELRAGSGTAVLRMAQDLFSVLNEIRCADPNNAAEAVAKYFANVVFNRMLKYYAATYSGDGSPVSGVSFKSTETIAAAYLEEASTRPSDPTNASVWPNATALATISTREPADFPEDFNIPRGATYIAFDKTKKRFYYPQSFNVSGMGVPGSGDTYNALSYFYPAELLYFGNSPIRVSSEDKQANDYPHIAGSTATGSWEKDASWDPGWTGSEVEAATRAVAMKYDINYGVALLGARVKYSSAAYTAGYLNDNNHNVQVEWHGSSAEGETDKPVPINVDGAFQVTGLIIGGQSEYIGWDHLPCEGPAEAGYKYGFLYDKAIPASAASVPYSATATSGWNYTLVYDNFHAASQTAAGIYVPEATQDKVYVAVEFLNNTGKDFYGNHNLIQDGGRFYLIGCLDPANGGDITWPTNYVIPPYKADGTSQKVKRVFMQDYLTSATFTLDVNSLHAAYLTVPDLRASSMTLGLSVDLDWRTGLTFDNVVLGQ